MTFLIQKDELFRVLYEVQEGKSELPPQKICAILGAFRKSLSLSWLYKIKKHDAKSCLTLCIITTLKFTEHPDASVRVIAFGTLGAMLLCVATFDPTLFIHAFGNSTSQVPVSPRSSMAIINMFVYLSRFVSSVQLQDFIIVVPVLNHFDADISDFLKFLPKTIPLMKDLPSSFHKEMMKTLLCTCSKRHNSSFTGAISALISLDKKLLVPYFKELIIKYNLQPLVICLGPTLINDREIYDLLDDDGRELFLNLALNELSRDPPGFIEFEASCLTCSQFLKYAMKTEKYESLHKRIFSHLKEEYPPHFKRLRMLLPMSLDDILKVNEETDSMKAAQIFALADFYVNNYEKTDPDEVSKIMFSYRFSRNDLYCSLIECFTKCIMLFLRYCKERYHIRLLRWILQKTNINWVHDMAVANLLCSIDCCFCMKIYPDFFTLAIARLLEFSLSPNNRLFSASIAAIKQISSYETLHELISTIVRSDWIDEFNVSRRFELLSTLASMYKSDEFDIFIPIAFECLIFFNSTNIVSNVCSFLSKLKVKRIPENVRMFCFNFVASNFESFTQMPMNIPVTGYQDPQPAPNFLDTIDTDIVTNPAFDLETSLAPIRNCFHFLCTLPLEILKDTDIFFWYCIDLIPLFGQEALEKAFEIQEYKPVDDEILWKVLLKTFETSSKDSVTAACCKLISRSRKTIPANIDVMFEKYLIEQRSKDPDLLYYIFVLVDQLQHDKAIQSVPTMVSGLDQKIASVLLFKLVLVIGREMVNTIDEKYAIALLQFANFYDGEYTIKVNHYLDNTPFSEWPLNDPIMNAELITFMKKNQRKQNIEDYNELDQQHLLFIIQNRDIFELNNFNEFIEKNPSLFSKIDISSFYNQDSLTKTFHFNCDAIDELKISTVSPILRNGNIVHSRGLLNSFFQFSNVLISESLFNQIFTTIIPLFNNNSHDEIQHSPRRSSMTNLETDNNLNQDSNTYESNNTNYASNFLEKTFIETYKYAFEYAIRNKLKIDMNFILNNKSFFENEVLFTTMISYLRTRYNKIDQLDSNLREKIESKLERKIEPRNIIGSKWRKALRQLVLLEPNYFLKLFTEQTEFRGFQFKSLILLLYDVDFDPVILHEIISIHLSVYTGFESIKKKALLIRFITVVIDSLIKKNKKVEADLIISFFSASFEMILEFEFPALYQELSYLTQVILPYMKNYNQISSFIEKFINNTNFYPLYLRQMTQLFSYRQIHLINHEMFVSLFESEIPSFSIIALSCLNELAISEAPPLAIQIVSESCMSIIKIMAMLSMNQTTSLLTETLTKKLLQNLRIFKAPQLFFDNFIITFLTNDKFPSFLIGIDIIPLILDSYQRYVESLFNINFYNDKIGEIFIKILEARSQNIIQQRAINDRICTFFAAHPSISLSLILYSASIKSNSIESTTCFLMNSLVHPNYPFLPFFLALAKFLFKSPLLVESLSDIFNQIQPKSRCISLVMATSPNKDDILKSVIYAGSETDRVDKIESEFSTLLNNNI